MMGGGLLGLAAGPALAAFGPPVAKPRFSVMLWTLEGKAPFDRCLETVAAAGYQGVELVGEFQRWTPEETGRVLTRMRALGLVFDAMSGLKAGFAVAADTDAFLAQFRAQLVSAQALGCPQVILLSGAKAGSEADQRRVAIENLTRAAELAAEAKVEIVIEPIDPLEQPTIYLQTVTAAFDLVRAVNRPNVKVLYDLYHEQRAFGNLTEKLRANIDLVGLIHVADVPGRHEPGTGEIEYANVFRTLAALQYQRWMAMEFYPTGDPVATLRTAREAALQAFA